MFLGLGFGCACLLGISLTCVWWGGFRVILSGGFGIDCGFWVPGGFGVCDLCFLIRGIVLVWI